MGTESLVLESTHNQTGYNLQRSSTLMCAIASCFFTLKYACQDIRYAQSFYPPSFVTSLGLAFEAASFNSKELLLYVAMLIGHFFSHGCITAAFLLKFYIDQLNGVFAFL